MGNSKRVKRVIYVIVAVFFIGMLMFISRGPYISNALKKIILPELESMTGHKVIAPKIYFNVFPLFVEAKGLKVYDDAGNSVIGVQKAKAYVSLSGIFRKKMILKRISIREPEISVDKEKINEITGKIKEYFNKKVGDDINVEVNSIEVRNGGFTFYDTAKGTVITGSGFDGEIMLGYTPRIKAGIKELFVSVRDYPELRLEINTLLFLKKEGVEIKNITLGVYGSKVQASGFYSPDGKGSLKTDLNLLFDSLKKAFKLKKSGEGKIYVKGDIRFENGAPAFDLTLNGDFYLQSLMEILKVTEKIEGHVDFDGKISGTLSEISGSADAKLRKGNLFGIDVDELKCKVFYADGLLSFKNGKASLYNGQADAEASLSIPLVNQYSVAVKFNNVDSPSILKLIGWQPKIPEGKVKGDFYTTGDKFNPFGRFEYVSSKTGKDVLGRIRNITGKYKLMDNTVFLSDLMLSSEKSKIEAEGFVDTKASLINIRFKLKTDEITDLTLPYFNRVRGIGYFEGMITGKSDDPVISGSVKINDVFLDNYPIDNIRGELSYRKNLLEIKNLFAKSAEEQHFVSGNIGFDAARELFELKNPSYNLTVSLRSADLNKLIAVFYKKMQIKGRLDSDFRILGQTPDFAGSATFYEIDVNGHKADKLTMDFNYNFKDFIVKNAILKNDKSILKAEGRIAEKNKFDFKASSDKFFTKDFGINGLPEDSFLIIKAVGSGTFEDPSINLEIKFDGGTLQGSHIGDGLITASIKNRDVLFNAALLNEKVRIKGKAYLSDQFPWSAEVDIQSSRYDFILSRILKNMPEDLMVNIKGNAVLSGDKKHYNGSLVLDQVNITLFGNSFSNESDIRIKLVNKKISFLSFSMRSGNSLFSVKGDLEVGQGYDIVLEGQSALTPLKGFSKKISTLKGDADFKINILGKWDSPAIGGNFNITNALFGLTNIHQRISSIEGNLFFEKDRIVIQKLVGKFGGGDIDIAGFIDIEKFKVRRFYLDSRLYDVTISVSKDFDVNVGGNVVYKGTLDSQEITGEVKINRARYRERVEWKSWLLKAKPKERPRGELTVIDKAKLNVKVYGTDNIVIDNNVAIAQLRVDLILRGTISQPLFFGRVASKEGKVYFRNNEFHILSASADFADPSRINPVMEITAQAIVKEYTIRLSLEGQIEHFNLSLISDPPLEETDILSLLTVGQIGRELKGFEGGIGAGEATAFLTGKFQDVFEERLRNITGFDRIHVDPYASTSAGTVGPRVTVSKRLLGESLFVTYTSSVGSTEEQIIKLEYILGKNVSLIGERDEKGGMSGDIRFRFEFK